MYIKDVDRNDHGELTGTLYKSSADIFEMREYEDLTVSFKVNFKGENVFLVDPEDTMSPITTTTGANGIYFKRVKLDERPGFVLKMEKGEHYWAFPDRTDNNEYPVYADVREANRNSATRFKFEEQS